MPRRNTQSTTTGNGRVRDPASPSPGTAGAPSTRAEKSHLTRAAVLRAAAECFDEAGYLATPLDDVTTRAGVTKGAVYFHFGSKQALADALIEAQRDHWAGVVEEITSRPGSALDHVVQLTYEMAGQLRQDVELRAGVRLATDPDVPSGNPLAIIEQWEAMLETLLRRARRDGSMASGGSPAAAARVIVLFFLATHGLDLLTDRTRDPRRRLDEFWGLVLPGIAAR